MPTIQLLNSTKPSITDTQVLTIERSSEDESQLDVVSKGQILAYVEVEDGKLTVCELEIELTKEDVRRIKSLCVDFLTQEMADDTIEAEYAEYYAVNYREDQKTA